MKPGNTVQLFTIQKSIVMSEIQVSSSAGSFLEMFMEEDTKATKMLKATEIARAQVHKLMTFVHECDGKVIELERKLKASLGDTSVPAARIVSFQCELQVAIEEAKVAKDIIATYFKEFAPAN